MCGLEQISRICRCRIQIQELAWVESSSLLAGRRVTL